MCLALLAKVSEYILKIFVLINPHLQSITANQCKIDFCLNISYNDCQRLVKHYKNMTELFVAKYKVCKKHSCILIGTPTNE